MSTEYVVHPAVSKDTFIKTVQKLNWVLGIEDTSTWICDGTSYLHYTIINDELAAFTRYGRQETCEQMIDELSETLDTEIVDEYDDRYWDICDAEYAEDEE